ncbi:DegT/DnrJ/EryC1/StrS family aminotransferase [Geobacter pelophilus]|uniref:DegT/DnrJ/EryC1/StrS family aminotransferase n=1 Tax=Geoanaerobacter pelophilus TaxID=60036 RepID=A0AAW4L304_9BACT|nr:DegT/DnrJ/EryC1/StrS family aminotransferase [Geoanaerobacter pelophilus]MBT0663010.1 DegT/DnrJ/EryC1/StrS family aminotransferase [Geoanaerobacter pelophilus]
MNIPFLDLKAQYKSIKDEVNPAIQDVLDNTAYVMGKAVADFEAAFAFEHGVKHCLGTSSGTDGNHMVLWGLGVGSGDEVIIPANTFIATAWGATLCGATPVFVDCDPISYNIDPSKVEEAITSRTKAIVAVHLYGQPADMDALQAIATKHGIHLIEDCAQAHLAEYKNKRVGGFGRAASFSFYPGKNLGAYGEAGAVTTTDDDLAKKFRMIRDHGTLTKYNHEIYGHNYRMEGIQGAVLGVKLKHLNTWTEGRRRVASRYCEMLSGLDELMLPTEVSDRRHVYHLFVVQAPLRRDDLVKYLNEKGIATGLHYPVPLHMQPCFSHLNYDRGVMPVAEQLAENGLSLPMYPELTDEQLTYISNNIRHFFMK